MLPKNLQTNQEKGFSLLEIVGVITVIAIVLLTVGVVAKGGLNRSSSETKQEPPAYLISPPANTQPVTLREALINTFLIKGLVGQTVGKDNTITSVYLTLQENIGKLEIKLTQNQTLTGDIYVIQGPGLAIKNIHAENAGLFSGEYEDKARKSINDLLNNLVLVQQARNLAYIQIQPGQLVLYYQR